MLIVMKFGGSLLGSKRGIQRVAKIVRKYSKGKKVVVVVSALGYVTDLLLRAADSARNSHASKPLEVVEQLRRLHAKALGQLSTERSDEVARVLEALYGALGQTLEGVSLLKELTQRSRDLIVSFGERLSAPIVAAALADSGLAAKALTGGEAGIVSDDSFGEARPDFRRTEKRAKKGLIPMLTKGVVPVVTGFLAQSPEGEITTLGRGGSDYTATILAAALGADEVWIWTDVGGIMTGDPRVVESASVIKELSYAEAEEMAFFGAKNMHPLALSPARLGGIPVRIRNGHRPEVPGTLIHARERRMASVAKAILLVKSVGMLTVSGESLLGRPGTAARIFNTLGNHGINILMISQSVSESNISLVVRRNLLQRARSALKIGLDTRDLGARIEVEPDVAVVAAVGAGMKGTPGVAAKVFGAVAREGINVRMIAQGSSELNVSFVVKEKDSVRAVRALHSALVAGK